jgi:hypothetical protein
MGHKPRAEDVLAAGPQHHRREFCLKVLGDRQHSATAQATSNQPGDLPASMIQPRRERSRPDHDPMTIIVASKTESAH